jgi:hypothetical protein
MKAILVFDLPEEQEEHETAVNAVKWYSAMYDLDQYLRGQLKYNDAGEDYEKIRDELHEILENRGLSF